MFIMMPGGKELFSFYKSISRSTKKKYRLYIYRNITVITHKIKKKKNPKFYLNQMSSVCLALTKHKL